MKESLTLWESEACRLALSQQLFDSLSQTEQVGVSLC